MGVGGMGLLPSPYFVNDNHSHNDNHSQLSDFPNFVSENHSHLLVKLSKL
jgi:hypothetical protein